MTIASSSILPLPDLSSRDQLARGLVRRLLTGAVHAAYRLRVSGLENVPDSGPALIVSNHVSFIDWLFVGVALRHRTPRFVMHEEHFGSPVFRWFFDLHRVIPIAPRKVSPDRLEAALELIDEALADGELVMLFPEGTMSPDGQLSTLRPGVARIVRRRPVPVVPVALRGLWGSFFSRKGGPPMKKLPRRLRARVEVVVGSPIPPGDFELGLLRARLGALRGSLL